MRKAIRWPRAEQRIIEEHKLLLVFLKRLQSDMAGAVNGLPKSFLKTLMELTPPGFDSSTHGSVRQISMSIWAHQRAIANAMAIGKYDQVKILAAES